MFMFMKSYWRAISNNHSNIEIRLRRNLTWSCQEIALRWSYYTIVVASGLNYLQLPLGFYFSSKIILVSYYNVAATAEVPAFHPENPHLLALAVMLQKVRQTVVFEIWDSGRYHLKIRTSLESKFLLKFFLYTVFVRSIYTKVK